MLSVLLALVALETYGLKAPEEGSRSMTNMLLGSRLKRPNRWGTLVPDSKCKCLGFHDALRNNSEGVMDNTSFAKLNAADCNHLGAKVCDNFLLKLPNWRSMCLLKPKWLKSSDPEIVETDNWCFVDAKCPAHARFLSKAPYKLPSGKSYWRKCKHHNLKIGDHSIPAVKTMSNETKTDLALLIQFGYTEIDAKLEDVAGFFNITEVDGDASGKFALKTSVDSALKASMQKLVDEKPGRHFVNSQSGRPPYAVMENGALFWLNYGEKAKQHLKAKLDIDSMPAEDLYDLKCVANCDNAHGVPERIAYKAWWDDELNN